MKTLALPFLSLFYLFRISNATDGCNDDGWSPYSDEKCIKVFQHATTSYDEAEAFCALQVANGGGDGDEDNEALKSNSNGQTAVPRLLTIANAGQQAFVEKLLFGKRSIDTSSNIWLGGQYENDGFRWRRNYGRISFELDREKLSSSSSSEATSFSNWQSGHPKKGEAGYCLEMITRSENKTAKRGAWIEQPCANRPKSQVVCERLQQWPAAKLQELLIKVLQTMVPIGFTYVQLPKDRAPNELWPWYQWKDVSREYDSTFFRVVGKRAKPFGEKQNQHAPHITSFHPTECASERDGRCKGSHEKDKNVGSIDGVASIGDYNDISALIMAKPLLTGTFTRDSGNLISHHLEIVYEAGEVRPTNMGVKVWRRTG